LTSGYGSKLKIDFNVDNKVLEHLGRYRLGLCHVDLTTDYFYVHVNVPLILCLNIQEWINVHTKMESHKVDLNNSTQEKKEKFSLNKVKYYCFGYT